MSLARGVMVGTLEISSRCGPGAAQPASTMEKIKIKRVDFTAPSFLFFYGTGMLDRERELRDLGIPEFAELGGAHKAHREPRVFVGRDDLRLRERLFDFRLEPRNDLRWRAGGGHDARPAGDLAVRISRFDHGPRLGQLRHAPRARH